MDSDVKKGSFLLTNRFNFWLKKKTLLMSVLNYAYFIRESFGTPKYNFCITDGRNNT